jgi:hypothetical protein
LSLSLSSSLQVPAVILTLSEVEWGRIPKNFTHPNGWNIFTYTLKRRCLFFSHNAKIPGNSNSPP